MNRSLANNPTQDNIFPEGFLPLHTGLKDHLQDGRMTPPMLAVYIVLQYQTEWSSGRWNGNCHRIHNGLGGKLSLSQIRRIMTKLERAKYIRRFKKQGLIGNYFVLVHKYRVRLGEVKGMVLNAFDSPGWDNPKYEVRSENEVTCVSDAPDVRVTCVSDACDMRLYQEGKEGFQDSQQGKEGNNSINNAKPVADAAITKPSFVGQVKTLLTSFGLSDQTTAKHEAAAWKLVKTHGADMVLCVFESWLLRNYESIGERGVPETWVLNRFVESGGFETSKPAIDRLMSAGFNYIDCIEYKQLEHRHGMLPDEDEYPALLSIAREMGWKELRVEIVRQRGLHWLYKLLEERKTLQACGLSTSGQVAAQ